MQALQLLIQEGEDHSLQLLQTSNHVMDSFSSLATDWVHEVSKAKRISVIENHNIGRALLPAKSFLCGKSSKRLRFLFNPPNLHYSPVALPGATEE